MGFFKELLDYLAASGEQSIIETQREILKEMRGTPGLNGPDLDMEYYEKHGELPSQKRLREFDEKHGFR